MNPCQEHAFTLALQTILKNQIQLARMVAANNYYAQKEAERVETETKQVIQRVGELLK